jgi:ferrous iron transport protein A
MAYAVIARKNKGEINMTNIDLAQMGAGQSGKVITMHGGRGMTAKLEALGIRPGVVITKVSGQIMRGPVIIRVGNTQVAIGFGMARRVIVALEV